MPGPKLPPRTPTEVLELCRQYSATGTYVIAEPAHERLKVQGLSQGDVVNVLSAPASCTFASGRRWTIHGTSLDGAPLSILVAFDHDSVTVL